MMVNVASSMALYPGNFPVPNPTLANLNNDAITLLNAITTWGPVHNRGSHQNYVDLIAAAQQGYNDLLLEAAYVESQIPPGLSYVSQVIFIGSSGFLAKNNPSPQGLLQAPQRSNQAHVRFNIRR